MTMTVDGTPVSDADLARMHAEEELHARWQRRTVRVVAASASDATDCRLLLDILGLDADVIAQARAEFAAPPQPQRRTRTSPVPKTTRKPTEAKTPATRKARATAAA
jgi:hypothetical protein